MNPASGSPSPASPIDQVEPSTEGRTGRRRFGAKHLAALLLAVAIPALIFVFRDQVRGFEQLGYAGAFLVMLVGNATVILPAPGLILVFAMGHTYDPLLLGLAAGAGAALGELVGYFAGFSGSGYIKTTALYRRVERWVEHRGPVVITVLAAIPSPVFDLAGLAAGALGMRWPKFLMAAWIGKTVQAIAIAFAGSLSIGWVEQLLR